MLSDSGTQPKEGRDDLWAQEDHLGRTTMVEEYDFFPEVEDYDHFPEAEEYDFFPEDQWEYDWDACEDVWTLGSEHVCEADDDHANVTTAKLIARHLLSLEVFALRLGPKEMSVFVDSTLDNDNQLDAATSAVCRHYDPHSIIFGPCKAKRANPHGIMNVCSTRWRAGTNDNSTDAYRIDLLFATPEEAQAAAALSPPTWNQKPASVLTSWRAQPLATAAN
ncbi:hypothetical protein ACM66B_006811 [Microbotryomycetes sp. NB124-2]